MHTQREINIYKLQYSVNKYMLFLLTGRPEISCLSSGDVDFPLVYQQSDLKYLQDTVVV